VASEWLDVHVSTGSEGLQAAWLKVIGGQIPAREGNVIQLG
jgi:hypothetical protein